VSTCRREIGQLRTLGMTRRQVLTQALLDAGLVGLLGAALGLVFGLAVGAGMVAVVRSLNGDNGAIGAVIPWDAWPLAAGAGVLVTVLVTLGLARDAARVSPLEAVKPPAESPAQQRRTRRWLIAAALLLLAATAGLYVWGADYARTALTPSYGPIFALTLPFGTAVIVLLPLVLDGLLTLLERGHWLAGRLAAASLRRQGARAAVTAATLTISFMLVIALTGLTLFMSQFLLTFNLSLFTGRVVVIRPFPPGTSLSASAALPSLPPLPPGLRADIEALEEVAEIAYFANVSLPGLGIESGAGDQYAFATSLAIIRDKRTFPIAEGSWTEAERIFAEHAPAILLPELTGRKLNKHPGDPLEIQTLHGPVTFTVAAVGGGFPLISPEAAAEYFGANPFAILFTPKPGVTLAALQARVDALREQHRAELAPFDTAQVTTTIDALLGPIQALFGGLTSLSGLVAALGIVVTLFASVLERQREIGTLRALGLRRDEVRGLVVLEAGLLGFAGAGLGALGGLGLSVLFVLSMNTAMAAVAGVSPVEGLPVPWELALAALFIGPAIAMLAALWPAGRAADVDPAVAMRAEGATGFAPPAAKRPAHPRRRALPRSLSLTLALRSLDQQRTRTYLSLTAIALGACMTVAGDMLSQSIIGVVTRTEDLRAIGQGLWSQLDPAFKGIGAGIMLAAGFLIFNTFAMSVTQRRQQIGALRALGMTRGQVLRMVLTEALLVGGAGTVLGVLLGPLVGRGLIALMRSLQNSLLNVFVSAEPSPLSYGLAIALGLGITLLASLVPARAATRLSPLVALKTPEQSGLDRSPRRLGAAGLSLGLALMVWLAVSPPALWLPPPWEVITTLAVAAVWLTSLALLLPAAVGALGASLRPALARVGGAPGRLMADNLRRGRGRVLVTVATLALSLTMIGGLTGFIQFYLFEQFGPKMEELRRQNAWIIMQMDITSGLAGYANLESLRTPPEAQAELRALLGDRADLMPFGFVIVPELSFMGDAYFSFMLDPDLLARSGSLFMTFKEGAWDSALPIMRAGCGLLVTPGIAAENRVGLGQTLSVHGPRGPVTCTIAGIGSTFVGASIISQAAADQFDPGAPFSLFVQSRPGTDAQQLDADLTAAAGRLDLHLLRMDQYLGLMLTVFENVPLFFNAFLLLAVLAA
ncbi:MAG: ABC transporter permease, partial [Anaerolineales bacterium]|nr:ABC transporter permease [Anaerolineales bacterium]